MPPTPKTSLLITDGGDPIPSEDFPEMARWTLEGRLDLDGMVTRELGLRRPRRGVPGDAGRRGDPHGRGVRPVTAELGAERALRGDLDAWWRFGVPIADPIVRALFRVRVAGIHHVPLAGPAILAFVHVSVLDGPSLAAEVAWRRRRTLRFLVAAEIFHVPVSGWFLRRYRQIPVRRGESDTGALDEAHRHDPPRRRRGDRAGRSRPTPRPASPADPERIAHRAPHRRARDPGGDPGNAASMAEGWPALGTPLPTSARLRVRAGDRTEWRRVRPGRHRRFRDARPRSARAPACRGALAGG